MTMFRDFLDIRQDSKDIFSGLKIMDRKEVVDCYMNQYPVVFMSLKEIFGETFDEIFRNFQIAVANVCEGLTYLLKSDGVDDVQKAFFDALRRKEGRKEDTVQSLDLFCRILKQYYNKPVFVIIDEYDVPMAKALGTSEYDRVRDMIEHMLSYVCKTNENVKGIILSGCLYTVKNSTYTGVNNIIPYTVLSNNFASAIGFTDDNVRTLLDDVGLPEQYDTVAEWYNGYIFGRDRMYCPWDVLLYVRSVLDGSYSKSMGPKSYWVNTSETSQNIIHGFMGKTSGANENFELLLAGGSIECIVNDNLPYHRIYESGDNLWSALLETGYLTKAVDEEMTMMPLRIPNKEIMAVFRQEVWDYFEDKVDIVFVREMVDALWTGEIKKAEETLNLILEATLSFYHEYHEYSYHLILDGIFTGKGYRVQSERETGYGRSDLIIQDPVRERCLLLELKHVGNEGELESALLEAESQIIKNKYESQLIYEGYTKRLKYGMAFHGKKACICKVGS
jgi:hypothetical protein